MFNKIRLFHYTLSGWHLKWDSPYTPWQIGIPLNLRSWNILGASIRSNSLPHSYCSQPMGPEHVPVFVAIFSWAMRTFSEPLMMKYPPGSSGHSFNSVKSRSVRPFSRQYVDRSMMGIFPMNVLWCCVSTGSSPSFTTVFVISTYSGAEYLKATGSYTGFELSSRDGNLFLVDTFSCVTIQLKNGLPPVYSIYIFINS